MKGVLLRSIFWFGLTLFLSPSLVSCASLANYLVQTQTIRQGTVPQPPLHPLLVSQTSLSVGKYTLTPLERKVIREIFGPPVARWVEKRVRVGLDVEFDNERIAAVFQPSSKSILLRHDLSANRTDAEKFATLIHEVTHY